MKKYFLPLLALPLASYAACDLTKNAAGEYEIAKFADLLQVSDCGVDGDYRLTADIVADDTPFSVSMFSGKFHGAGHVIKNLKLKASFKAAGLFNNMSEGYVDSLGLENVALAEPGMANDVGGIAAGFSNSGTIKQVYVKGKLVGSSSGSSSAGGIASSFSGTIEDCYFDGEVGGADNIGGIVGTNSGTVTRSYAHNTWDLLSSATPAWGAIVGTNEGSVSNSYGASNNANTAIGSDNGTTVKSVGISNGRYDKKEMKSAAFYEGWTFGTTWLIAEEYTTPMLRAFMKEVVVTAKNVGIEYCTQKLNEGWELAYSEDVDETIIGGGVNLKASITDGVAKGILDVSGLFSIKQDGYWFSSKEFDIPALKAKLTIEGLSVEDKDFDGTTAATLKGEPKLVGVCNDDVVSLATIGGAEFESIEGGIDKPVNLIGLELVGDAKVLANYELVMPKLTATIQDYNAIGFAPKTFVVKPSSKMYNVRGVPVNKKDAKHVRTFAK